MELSGDVFGRKGGPGDLGPRGQTELRLILTPRPQANPTPPAPVSPPPHVAPVRAATRKESAPAQETQRILDRLRRDTLVRMLIGAPVNAFVFITFHEWSSIPMATPDELRDEELAGGFDDEENDDTFLAASIQPPIAPPPIVPPPIAPPPEPGASAEIVHPRFPFKTILFGLPLVMLLAAGVLIYSWRHENVRTGAQEIQMAPSASSNPTTTAGEIARERPVPQSATPVVPAPAPVAPVAVPQPQAAATAPASPATTVSQESVPKTEQRENASATPARGHYEIQVVATPSRSEAERQVAALVARGAHAFLREIDRDGITMYRVRLGGYTSNAAARADGARLGLRSLWIERTGR